MLAKIPSILVCMDFQGIINEVHHNLVEIKMDFRVFAWLPSKTIQCTFIFIVITNFPNYKMTTLPVTRDLAFIWGRDLRGSGTRDDGPENPTQSLDNYYQTMCAGVIGGKMEIAEMLSH